MALNILRNAVAKLQISSLPVRRLSSVHDKVLKPNLGILPQLTSSVQNNWIYKQETPIGHPLRSRLPISMPNGLLYVPPLEEPETNKVIEAPTNIQPEEKQAARLIVIRRKKMRKHKLLKLRKRMKFEWAKIRQRRELLKEKVFQAGLIAQCKRAETFSAEAYVEERLQKLNEMVIPKKWKGKRLPEFIIREKLGLPPK